MKTIFNDNDFAALLARVEAIQPAAARQWGKMDVAQMMAHCDRAISLSLGVIAAPSQSNWFLRRLIKPMAIGRLPIKRNSPTSDSMRITEEKDFQTEKQKLVDSLRAAKARGIKGEWVPHVAFGVLTAAEWGRLHHKHVDYHLQQFSA